MKTIPVKNFGEGMATDIYSGGVGELSTTRNFDILSYPNKLFPLASMQTGTTGTLIGNIIIGSDGIVYGAGVTNSTEGGLYYLNGSNVWTLLSSTAGTSGPLYNFLVEYKQYGSKSILFMDNTIMIAVDQSGNLSTTAATFTPTSIGQGFVHPKDKLLYVPYQIAGTTVIGILTGTGDNVSHWAQAAFTLPSQYNIVGLTNYGDYLAIACTTYSAGLVSGSVNASIVFLWDRNTANPLPNESIPWGDNLLQVLNNLNGVLVGISSFRDDDNSSILIKGYSGGQVETLKEIPVVKQTTTSPSITINTRVNFIHRNRLYFSADLVGGSTSPSQKGLWSIGKNRQGRWCISVERFASTDGSDVSIIAAAFRLGYLYACHTSEGTMTDSFVGSTLTTRFASPSIYESVVNPEMSETDRLTKKKLISFQLYTLPLTSSGQVVAKYRVDVSGNASNWTTIFTKTSTTPDANLVFYMSGKPASGQFRDGFNYEFRIESTGGAQVIGYSYSYNPITQ